MFVILPEGGGENTWPRRTGRDAPGPWRPGCAVATTTICPGSLSARVRSMRARRCLEELLDCEGATGDPNFGSNWSPPTHGPRSQPGGSPRACRRREKPTPPEDDGCASATTPLPDYNRTRGVADPARSARWAGGPADSDRLRTLARQGVQVDRHGDRLTSPKAATNSGGDLLSDLESARRGRRIRRPRRRPGPPVNLPPTAIRPPPWRPGPLRPENPPISKWWSRSPWTPSCVTSALGRSPARHCGRR